MSKKNIIVTGTSRGIGYELVKKFSQQGYNVLALSRNAEPIKQLNLDNVVAIPFDITSECDIQGVVQFVKNKWESVDILIHNAGALLNKPFEEISSTEFARIYKVNVFGVAALTRELLPFLKQQSHVLAVSSMGGIQGSMKFPGLAAYSSSKGALITLFELLAEEYKENNIAFNTLALGAVQTEMLEEAFPGYKALLTAEEMADYISDFALTGNKYYNGKVLQVSASTP
tara:strand:+ start:83 stop:769 length:687 start_codon:yes stop_codon:yes gene_type:complete